MSGRPKRARRAAGDAAALAERSIRCSVATFVLRFGFGSARIVLIEAFGWAGTGHNLWIEAALSVGIVGAAVLTAVLAWMLGRAIVLQQRQPGPYSNLGLGFVVMILLTGIAGTVLALPGVAFSISGLLVAALTAQPGLRTLPLSDGVSVRAQPRGDIES